MKSETVYYVSTLTGEMSTLSGGMVICSLISDVHEITIFIQLTL